MLASAIVSLTPSDPDGDPIALEGGANVTSCTKHISGGNTYYDFLVQAPPAGYRLAPFLQQGNGVGFPGLTPEVNALTSPANTVRVFFPGPQDDDVTFYLFVFAVESLV